MFLLKGILIGMIVAIPIGPLGLLSVQRTINKGWKTGFLSAFGAATSDLIYSSIAILGISMIDDFIKRHRSIISGLTGILFLIVGINIFISAVEKRREQEIDEKDTIHPIFTHFLMGLSNPMTFIVFFAIFTKIGIYVDESRIVEQIMFVISIYMGSSILWLFITNLIERTKKSYKFESFILIDKIIGGVIIFFGIISILKGIM